MAEIVRDNFYQGLRMDPDGTRYDATVFDEIRWALQWQNTAVPKTCQLISQFHGPYVGGSGTMANVMGAIAGADSTLQRISRNAGQAVARVQSAIVGVTQIANTINQITCSQMSTPFLRYFVTECQVLHPDVTAFIQQNISQYPYFQQVSEQIGSHFTVISDCNEIDPFFTIPCFDLPIENLKMAARMVRPLFSKMFKAQQGNMEDSQRFLDTLFLRAMPCEENHALTHPNYAREKPIAHGNNFCMDVFHQKRAENAIPGVLAELVRIFGDRLRLLNQIFPVQYRVKHEEKIYEIDVEGERQQVDRLNRVVPPREPKIERSLKGNFERFEDDGEK